jgi:hypothetical protein
MLGLALLELTKSGKVLKEFSYFNLFKFGKDFA